MPNIKITNINIAMIGTVLGYAFTLKINNNTNITIFDKNIETQTLTTSSMEIYCHKVLLTLKSKEKPKLIRIVNGK